VTGASGNIGVFLVLFLIGTAAFASEDSALLPRIPPGKGESCVEPTDVMRRDHMKFLLHQRDETVHGGIRGAKHSLVGCIGCHVQRDAKGDAIPVNAEGQFCESCHGFAGVRMDCFECHAAVPASGNIRFENAAGVWPLAASVGDTVSPGAR
jgi:hypothetical protein